MKFLRSRGLTVGLAIGIALTTWIGFNHSSLALPESQVIQKLEQIPMFIIVNQDGELVLVNPKTASDEPTPSPGLIIFGDYNDAFNMRENLQQNNSELSGIQVIPISFSRVYEMLKRLNQEPDKLPPVILYSEQEEILAATKIRQERGENGENIENLGLPLFFVTTGNNEEFIVKEDEEGKPFIPFYMELKEAQADVEQYKQQFPNVGSQEVKIQVIPLLELIQVWLEQDEETLKLIEVIPSEQQVNEANRLLDNSQTQPRN